MERGSDKHGHRLDEALAKETRALVTGGHDNREEWNSPEPSGEDQPEVDSGRLVGGTPEGLTPEDVEGRSRLASLLGKEIWPAETQQIRERVVDQGGEDSVIELVGRLPEGRVYVNVAEVWKDLNGGVEQHRF
ncbi:MAG: hypothetical protein JWO12_1266 [Frankiales bacterium]|nr:hypothetical protein [Frankiales bacterium]